MEKEVIYKVGGMTCILCADKLESRIKKLSGVEEVKVNYSTEIVSVIFQEELCSEEILQKTISSVGFFIDDGEKAEQYLKSMKKKIIAGFLLILPIMIAMISCWLDDLATVIDPYYEHEITVWLSSLRYKLYLLHDWRLQLFLVFPVQFIIGFPFYKNAWYSLKTRQFGMDLLVAIGTLSTFGYSLYIVWMNPVLTNKNLYFESGAMIILLIYVGKYLEIAAKKRTSNSIEALMKLQPQSAFIIVEGKEIIREITEIQIGDTIAVHPEEIISLDGYIIEGNSSVDESMITGESEEKEKGRGELVLAGTKNLQGNLKVEVVKNSKDTLLSSIIEIAAQAQSSKPNIQKLTDLLSRYFTLVILTIAGLAFCFWYFYVYHASTLYLEQAVLSAVSVLVVSCPCAIGLAIPMAVSTGVGIGAKHGILIKNAQALQALAKVDTIIFDKTGTLTQGSCKVRQVVQLRKNSPYSIEEILAYLCGLEREKGQEHPIGKAILQYTRELEITIPQAQNVQEIPGKGIVGEVKQKKVKVGNEKLIPTGKGITVQNTKGIESRIFVEIEGELEAVLYISHQIKNGAYRTISYLKNSGLDVIIMSGDQKSSTESIGKLLGIKNIYSQLLPTDKLHLISDLKKEGKVVCMVGDGTNDAPALSKADISIAMDTGTEVAMKSSDIVVLGNSIDKVVMVIELSKKTMKKIYGNLFLAVIYNIIAIPAAFLGKLSPEIASAAMGLSSISVVLNSVWLKRFRGGGKS